jgi:Helix-turn-helix domain
MGNSAGLKRTKGLGENTPEPDTGAKNDSKAPGGFSEAQAKPGKPRRLIGTRELATLWSLPESTLRYWRCAGLGPTFVKLGGRIKYDVDDVDRYVRANKRMPSVRAHGG